MKKKANEPSYTVSLSYDADGNMTSDGRFHYFWNGENRLVMASNAEYVVTYAYDHRGRMVRKEISHEGTENGIPLGRLVQNWRSQCFCRWRSVYGGFESQT